MIPPIETWIIIGLFHGIGSIDGKEFNSEVRCEVYKEFLTKHWKDNDVDENVIFMTCRREDGTN